MGVLSGEPGKPSMAGRARILAALAPARSCLWQTCRCQPILGELNLCCISFETTPIWLPLYVAQNLILSKQAQISFLGL